MASLLCILRLCCSVWYIKRMWRTRQTAASPKNAIVILSTRVRLQTHTFTFTSKPGRYLSVYELLRHGDRSTSPLSAYGKMGRFLVNAKDHGKGQSKKKKKKESLRSSSRCLACFENSFPRFPLIHSAPGYNEKRDRFLFTVIFTDIVKVWSLVEIV